MKSKRKLLNEGRSLRKAEKNKKNELLYGGMTVVEKRRAAAAAYYKKNRESILIRINTKNRRAGKLAKLTIALEKMTTENENLKAQIRTLIK